MEKRFKKYKNHKSESNSFSENLTQKFPFSYCTH